MNRKVNLRFVVQSVVCVWEGGGGGGGVDLSVVSVFG